MGKFLAFQLYGPLVSWGTQAVGQERPSDDHPGRSALLGLIAAAMGIDRLDEDQHAALSDGLRFGLKVYSPGLLLRDFHTTQVPASARQVSHRQTRHDELRESNLGTMLSFRTYCQDALSVVALSIVDTTYTLDEVRKALLKPRYHLYFGRKSCPPAAPLNPLISDAATLKKALDSYEVLEELLVLPINKVRARYYWERMDNVGMTEDYRAARYDQPLSRRRWQFISREEFVLLGGEPCT